MPRTLDVCLQLVNTENVLMDEQHLRASDDGKHVDFRCLQGPLAGKVYNGVDYFWLLAELRTDLIDSQLRPLVMGAKKNVFAGGMLGETSLGLMAYELDETGKGAGAVGIFDPVDISEAKSVVFFDEQKSHRKALAQKRKLSRNRT